MHHTRRILLAFSLAASAASVAFADYQNITQATEGDRLEQLSQTLAQGSYTHPDDLDLPAISNVSLKLREKTIELNNATIEKKYGRSGQCTKILCQYRLFVDGEPSITGRTCEFHLGNPNLIGFNPSSFRC